MILHHEDFVLLEKSLGIFRLVFSPFYQNDLTKDIIYRRGKCIIIILAFRGKEKEEFGLETQDLSIALVAVVYLI